MPINVVFVEKRCGCARWRSLAGSVQLFGLVPQYELLDLAGRGLRQLREHHGFRNLEAGQVLAAEADDVLLGYDTDSRLQGNEGAGSLAPPHVCQGSHRSLTHRR